MNLSVRAWIAVLIFSLSTTVYAVDRDGAFQLFRNVHESRSIIVSQDLSRMAQGTFGNQQSSKVEAAASEFLEHLAASEAVCEPRALSVLQAALARQGLPSSSEATREFLILMRSRNQLDDVVLFPLWKASGAWMDLGFPLEDNEGASERSSASSSDDAVERYFERLPEGCPTLAWKDYISRKRAQEKKNYSRATIVEDLVQASQRGLLSPRLMPWFIAFERDRTDEAPYFLDSILTHYKIAKNFHFSRRAIGARRGSEANSVREMSPFPSELAKRSVHTRRMGLYVRYNYDQITALSELLILHFQIAFAPKASIVYSDESGRPIYSHPLEGQDIYDSAAMVLRDLIIQTEQDDPATKNSSDLAKIPFEDLVLAGLETGAIDGSYVSEALKIDDLWNPPKSVREKVSTWVRRVVIPATILIPPPYNFAPSVIIALMDRILKPKARALPVFPGSFK